MDLNEAIARVAFGNRAVLFLGAGFSKISMNRLGEPVPPVSTLIERIGTRLHTTYPSTVPLDFAIDKLREAMPPQAAFDFLQNQLTTDQITETQSRILALPWRRIYTTNIDNIGSQFSGRKCLDAATPTREVETGDFIYLHGNLSASTPNNYYQNVKMGTQMYLSAVHSRSPYHSQLLKDLSECDCAIVIGYSMYDPDLASIFYNAPNVLNKCFVFSGVPEEYTTYKINAIGKNTNETADDFLARLDRTPPRSDKTYPQQVQEISAAFDGKPVSQIARQNLLVFGRFDQSVARASWANSEALRYTVDRSVGEEIVSAAAPTTLLVHASLGNGKSIAIEQAQFMTAASRRACFVIDPTVDLALLLEALNSLPDEAVVFFEGDVFWLTVFKRLSAKSAWYL